MRIHHDSNIEYLTYYYKRKLYILLKSLFKGGGAHHKTKSLGLTIVLVSSYKKQ
jgi:hypothetical protein